MNWISLMEIGLGLARTVPQLVLEFEGAGNGAQKKAVVKKMAHFAFSTALAAGVDKKISPESAQTLDSLIDTAIDATVEFYNAIGTFKHSEKVVTVEPTTLAPVK
jgi:hypothetical protein